MANGRIVVVGNLNVDIVAVTKGLPQIGEYMYGNELHFVHGGNGLNQAVAAARLGGNAKIIGFIGNDGFGKEMAAFLEKEGVDIQNLQVLKGELSGTVIYMLTGTEERHIVYPGSNMKATVKGMMEVAFDKNDMVISQLTIPQEVTKHVFERARNVGAKTILNLFPNYEVSRELLALADYVVLNEVELAFRTGNTEFINAQHRDLHMDMQTVMKHVKELRTRPEQTIIVTLAERGAVGIKGEDTTKVEGIKVNFVDATGAGDCFLGAFATALAEGKNFKDSLEFANRAAAISVQKVGATSSYPRRKDVDR